MENYVHTILQNLADQKDMTGSGIYGSGKRRRGRKPKRKGKGLIGGDDEVNLDEALSSLKASEGMEEMTEDEGEGIYGSGKRKKKFNIGKYARAIANGKTKAQAKLMARR